MRRPAEQLQDFYGMTPKNYIDSLRLMEAKRLLLDTQDDILDIAYAVGFGSISAFYRFFNENEKKSPSRYRKDAASCRESKE